MTLKIFPLGGCGEIGMNFTVLVVGDDHYIIDCGSLFADLSQPGVDLILPDIYYFKKRNIKPKAWLITHGHEDHIGALPYLYPELPAPLYSTDFSLELIKLKFEDIRFHKHNLKRWQPFKPVTIGQIKVTPYVVNHSIAEAMGLFIETPFGNVLHSGDYRIDVNPPEKSMSMKICDVLLVVVVFG